jgi:hypothetical protein
MSMLAYQGITLDQVEPLEAMLTDEVAPQQLTEAVIMMTSINVPLLNL